MFCSFSFSPFPIIIIIIIILIIIILILIIIIIIILYSSDDRGGMLVELSTVYICQCKIIISGVKL